MTETGAVVSSLGLRPGPENALGEARLHGEVYMTSGGGAITAGPPLADPSAPRLIKLSARKCPSARFLSLMLNQHLSPRRWLRVRFAWKARRGGGGCGGGGVGV